MHMKKIIVLSAPSKEQLHKLVLQFVEVLDSGIYDEKDLLNICYTLQIGRDHLMCRMAVVIDSFQELCDSLKSFLNGEADISGILICENSKSDILPFGCDDELNMFINELIMNNKLHQLASLWTSGFDFDWEEINNGLAEKPHSVSLPTYSFSSDKYWLDDETRNCVIERSLNVGNKIPDSDYKIMTFQEKWKEEKLKKRIINEKNVIILFVPDNISTEELSVIRNGVLQNVVFIQFSNEYYQERKEIYHIRRNQKTDYLKCIEEVRNKYKTIDAVCYLSMGLNENHYQDVMGIFYLLQSYDELNLEIDRLLLLGIYSNSVEQSHYDSWIGFERSLKITMKFLKMNIIFMENGTENNPSITDVINNELYAEVIKSVWYDRGIRKVTNIVESKLIDNANQIIKMSGVYCLFGGLGGLGSIFAKWLAKEYKAKLIIVGRSDHNDIRYDDIKKSCREVTYLQGDICKKSELEHLASEIISVYGQIDGFFHTAGLVGGSSVFEKEYHEFEEILKANIEGTMNIEHMATSMNVDFLAYFCSIAAIIGDFGSCCYSIGKRFQMSYVEKLPANLKRVVINWPLWDSSGMKLDDKQSNQMYIKSSGQKLLDAQTGTELFEILLKQNDRQHLVFSGIRSKIESFLYDHKHAEENGTVDLINKVRVGNDNNEMLIQDIKNIISEILKIQPQKITMTSDFADFGFDSISLTKFANLISRFYQIKLRPDVFFNYPTVEKLCQHMNTKYSYILSRYYYVDNDEKTTNCNKDNHFEDDELETEKIVAKSIPKNVTREGKEPISIIGMSGRFPEAQNIEEFWETLKNGNEVTKEVILDRDGWNKYRDNTQLGGMKGKMKIGAMPDIFEFDPLFFSISPRDAEKMDPRQRLLLQETWKVLENAGYSRELLDSEKVGVFIGAEEGDYSILVGEEKTIMTNNISALAGRIAYFFDLHGPAMVIDTACSSALVALQQACLNIQAGVIDTAIVAGVSVLSNTSDYEMMLKAKIISPDGKCSAFDKNANGTIPGEAVAVIIIKREQLAIKDKHNIYGSIIDCGVNFDGKTNGFTAPSGKSQFELINEIYLENKVDLDKVDLIVTHGTGTKLGDSIEINALSDVFRKKKSDHQCALISMKPNIGHTLAASGIVSLIGLLQSMKNKMIPPSINCNDINEYIDWDENPFYVNRSLKDWNQSNTKERIGAVNAFGITGTNAHVVIKSDESDKETEEGIWNRPYYLLCYSAKSENSLNDILYTMKKFLIENNDVKIEDYSYNLQQGRFHLSNRIAMVVQDKESAIDTIERVLKGEVLSNIARNIVKSTFIKQESIKYNIKTKFELEKTLIKNNSEYYELLMSFAGLYCDGYEEVCRGIWYENHPNRIVMPSYCFARNKYEMKLSRDQKYFKSNELKISTIVYSSDVE